MIQKFFLIFIASRLLVAIFAQSGQDVNNLIAKLFKTDGYNKRVRPLIDQKQPVLVGVDFFLNSIIGFDEQEESLTTSGYLALRWTDEYIQWSPTTYNGLEYIFLPQDDVWKPDIVLRNAYMRFTGLGSSFTNVQAHSTGEIIWNPFQILKSTCSVDITYFPFDSQSCDLRFTAWSYSKDEVTLELGIRGIVLKEYRSNAAWDLVSTDARGVVSDEAAVIFTVYLKRKPLFYLLNVIAPVVMLTVLNSFTFVLPISSGEKASFSITVFLSLAVFLTILASELPKNSDTTSFLGIYLMLMNTLSTIIVAVCLIQTRLAARDVEKHPVNAFYTAVYRFAQLVRCKGKRHCSLYPSKRKVDPESKSNVNEFALTDRKTSVPSADVIAEDDKVVWFDVVNAMDVLLFWFCIVFTFLCTTIITTMAINNEGG